MRSGRFLGFFTIGRGVLVPACHWSLDVLRQILHDLRPAGEVYVLAGVMAWPWMQSFMPL